ncbi:MAG: FkbM family methyltransferase [Phycisphaerales bacterium]|jgi:FkbM family methyltransferase
MLQRLRDFSYWHVEKHLLPIFHRPERRVAVDVLGDFLVPAGLVRSGAICYCAGIGEDIRCETALIERFDAEVWALDPTPRAIGYVERMHPRSPRWHFLPVGLWRRDEVLRFHAPANETHVSHSVVGELGGHGHFEATCRSISSLMRELGHERLDLLKMNIEGAEYAVLEGMFEDRVKPGIVTLTFEGDRVLRKSIEWTKRFRAEGYALASQAGWYFAYVRRDLA